MVTTNTAKFFLFPNKQSLLLFLSVDACSSIGNNLATTDYVGENVFVNIVAIIGLVLLAALVGNMQVSTHSYSLLSITIVIHVSSFFMLWIL